MTIALETKGLEKSFGGLRVSALNYQIDEL
jgi:hypothetical protein